MSRLRRTSFTAALLATALAVTACSSAPDDAGDSADAPAEETVTLHVAGVAMSTIDIVEAASEAIGDGYEIDVVEVNDYVTVNRLLNDGEIHANFAQHEPFMEEFNDKNDAELVAVQSVYNFTIAFYSKELATIDELQDGATIAIPNDSSNLGRALKMLAEEGLIELDSDIDPYDATVANVAENPRGFEFLELEISQLNNAYDEADLVFQWPAHISALGLNPDDDGLITELDDVFALQLVVRAEDAESEETQALLDAFTSDEVRRVIEESDSIELSF